MKWNGYKAAISLTFDDGLKSQLRHAIPAMDRLGIKGTFFLASDCPDYPYDREAWKRVAANGHEIGSHSVTHRKAADLDEYDCITEARLSQSQLEYRLNCNVTSFCYPYTDAPRLLQDEVKRHYAQARGGRVARQDKCIMPGDKTVNVFNIPSFHVSNKAIKNELYPVIQETIDRGAWLTLMFHAVGDPAGWDNVDVVPFENLLADLAAEVIGGVLWVAPFGTVANHFRGTR